jgi:transposase InsO family protein
MERERLEEAVAVEMVQERRQQLPRIGGKKLYHLLKGDLQAAGKIGRDRFFKILKNNNLLIERKKSYTRTTNSYHHFHRHRNLIKDRKISRPNACWVADITYLRTSTGFVYLFLLTDYYSRKIVGWDLSNSLSIEGGLRALRMALKQRKGKSELIHHSDRGIQYCSHAYVNLLLKHGVQSSMTEDNHCYENAKAERVNGILKDEFLLDSTFKNGKEAHAAVREAIKSYNELRPHWSLNLQTPEAVHRQEAAQEKKIFHLALTF